MVQDRESVCPDSQNLVDMTGKNMETVSQNLGDLAGQSVSVDH